MATGKTSTLTFRIEPPLKEALRAAAGREHRSIANMVEVLIRDYCARNGIVIPEQGGLFDEDRQPPADGTCEQEGEEILVDCWRTTHRCQRIVLHIGRQDFVAGFHRTREIRAA